MGKPSPARASWPVFEGVEMRKRGKAWDVYRLGNGLLWFVATDCVSIFEISLNHKFGGKGASLVAYTVAAHLLLSKYGIQTHIVAYGADIDKYIPKQYRNDPDTQSRSLIVRELRMISDYELIVRHLVTGHGLEEYLGEGPEGLKTKGTICGQPLPGGLQDGDVLPYNMFTPTDKVDTGHDKNVPADPVREKYPKAVFRVLQAFDIMFNHALSRGVILADDKKECDEDGVIGDEMFTIDSSRWTLKRVWEESRKGDKRKMSSGFDKQYIRNWGISKGIKDLNPDNLADIAKVWDWQVPDGVAKHFIQGSMYLFWLLYGKRIRDFQVGDMGIALPRPEPKNVWVLCGSDSDFELVQSVCSQFSPADIHITIGDNASCHRAPDVIRQVGETPRSQYDLIIGAGSMALAQPGIMDAWSHFYGIDMPVAGVALGEPGSKKLEDAIRSIDGLPGQPVIMDEIAGKPYIGPEGLKAILNRVIYGELPPPKARKEVTPNLNKWRNF